MTEHTKAMQEKARKVGDEISAANGSPCTYSGVATAGYLHAVDDVMEVIEMLRSDAKDMGRGIWITCYAHLAQKLRNPEPELPEVVHEAANFLRQEAEYALKDHPSAQMRYGVLSRAADALEAEARKKGWK